MPCLPAKSVIVVFTSRSKSATAMDRVEFPGIRVLQQQEQIAGFVSCLGNFYLLRFAMEFDQRILDSQRMGANLQMVGFQGGLDLSRGDWGRWRQAVTGVGAVQVDSNR